MGRRRARVLTAALEPGDVREGRSGRDGRDRRCARPRRGLRRHVSLRRGRPRVVGVAGRPELAARGPRPRARLRTDHDHDRLRRRAAIAVGAPRPRAATRGRPARMARQAARPAAPGPVAEKTFRERYGTRWSRSRVALAGASAPANHRLDPGPGEPGPCRRCHFMGTSTPRRHRRRAAPARRRRTGRGCRRRSRACGPCRRATPTTRPR